MPNIVPAGGVNLTNQVFRIGDVAPPRKKKPRPKPVEHTADGAENFAADGELTPVELTEEGEGFQPETFDEYGKYDEYEGMSSGVKAEIIQSAMAEAARIVKEATEQAEAQRQEILARVQHEAEQMRRSAEDEGRKQGFAGVVGDMQELAINIEQAIARFEGDRAGFEMEYEEQLTWMAFEIASKVLAKKVSRDDTEMLEMVEKAVHTVQNESWVRIEVSQEMTRLIGRLIEIFDGQENIQVSPVPSMEGSVQIETPSGVVDASLRTQLENLREYFEKAGTP